MSLPAFIDLEASSQVSELRAHLKAKGADISADNSEDGPIADVTQLIVAVNDRWSHINNEHELESMLNSITYLMLLMPPDQNEGLVKLLCERIGKLHPNDKRNIIRVRVLNNLFFGLDEHLTHRYNVYMAIVRLANNADLLQIVNPQASMIKGWIAKWDVTTAQIQALWRAIYEACLEAKQSEKATKIMIELLSTYTEDNASQARDDAHKCIVACLGDPTTFLLDHLLNLKPVKFLEGELIHDLLTIFVSGKLTQYIQFYHANKDFVNSIGLSHDLNMQKMRLLTFMQLAETRQEIDFDTLQQEMQLHPDDIESFIIDVVRTKAMSGKIDQLARKVVISATTHRTFGKQQWQTLRDQMCSWQQNLEQVLVSLQNISHH